MGYRTYYSLAVRTADNSAEHENAEKIIAALREENESAEYALDVFGQTYEEASWYEHHDELKAFSLQYPDALFSLHGSGEDSEDMWDLYILNGKAQECPAQITYDDFDAAKLV